MLSTKTILSAFAVTTFTAVTAGCGLRNEAQLASDTSGAEDVNGTESDVESLGTSFVGSDGASVATQSLVGGSNVKLASGGTVDTGVPSFAFLPAGCLTVTEDTAKSTATYAFDGCTGPLGLVALTGTVTVGWQVAGNELTLDFSAQGFQINRATVDNWQATAVITSNGTQRSMTWNAQLSGTTGSGRQFNRTNQKSVQWTVGVACLSASGQSSGDILGANLQTTVVSWQRCEYACPQAGSEITVKDLDDGDSIDIQYDGGPTAELTLDGGKPREIRLACGD
ncbi:MAG TPA: hypothetical protein VGL81_16830 [Polyangiaceae bacterium]